jgi:hypothetical protein
MAREQEEPDRDKRREDTEKTRLEVVHLLRSILQGAKIQTHGPIPVITPDMQSVIDLYTQIESQIELTCPPPPIL